MRKCRKAVSGGEQCLDNPGGGMGVGIGDVVMNARDIAQRRGRPTRAHGLWRGRRDFFAFGKPEKPFTNPLMRHHSASRDVCTRLLDGPRLNLLVDLVEYRNRLIHLALRLARQHSTRFGVRPEADQPGRAHSSAKANPIARAW
jgi:hypothetical protein